MKKYELELKISFDVDMMINLGETYGEYILDYQSFNHFINVLLTQGLRVINEDTKKRVLFA